MTEKECLAAAFKQRPDLARYFVGVKRHAGWWESIGNIGVREARRQYDAGIAEIAQLRVGNTDNWVLICIPRKIPIKRDSRHTFRRMSLLAQDIYTPIQESR